MSLWWATAHVFTPYDWRPFTPPTADSQRYPMQHEYKQRWPAHQLPARVCAVETLHDRQTNKQTNRQTAQRARRRTHTRQTDTPRQTRTNGKHRQPGKRTNVRERRVSERASGRSSHLSQP
eukprot:7386847-Prymnesium_polylepis.1